MGVMSQGFDGFLANSLCEGGEVYEYIHALIIHTLTGESLDWLGLYVTMVAMAL